MPRISQPLFVIAFGFLLNIAAGPGQTSFISLFSSAIQDEIKVSSGELGTLYSLATLSSAFMLLFVGGLIERIGFGRATTLIVSGFAVGGLVLARATNWPMVLAGYFLIRCTANGCFSILGRSLIVMQFTRNRGRALSTAALGNPVGEASLPLLASFLLAWVGWRATWTVFALAIPLLSAPFLFLFLVRAMRSRESAPDISHLNEPAPLPILAVRGLGDVVKDPRFFLLIGPLLYTPFVLSGLFFYHHELADHKSWSMGWIAQGFVAYGAMNACGIVCVGRLIDRFSARLVLAFHMLPLIVGICALLFLDWKNSVFIYLGLAGFSIGLGGTAKAALWPELYGTAFIARLNSMAGSLITLATALGPPCTGFLIDHGVGMVAILEGVAGLGIVSSLFAFSFLQALGAQKRTGRL